VPILAARGVFALPAPEAAFLTLATVGICLAGLGVAAAESGQAGARARVVQVVRWRVRPAWYVVAILGPALFPLGGFLLGLSVGNPLPPVLPLQVWLSLPLMLVALLIPALLEEIGWRGYALPRLQRRVGTLPASLILGVIWAGVHLPLWLLPGFGFAEQSVAVYVVQVTAISVLLAWLYNATGGSLLLTGLAHAAINGWPMPWTSALQALPEAARGAPTLVLITAATAAVALIVVLASRRTAATT
jgi:membrane protease YdiL (CAAX protease family)